MAMPARTIELTAPPNVTPFVGVHPTVVRLLADVRQAAPLALPVLIQGPTGAGKELVAQRLHADSGRRGQLVAVNVASLPEALAESELFGSARGAFTDARRDRQGLMEEAAGGTLFLDEAADLPLALQAKLLRVIETGMVRRVGDRSDRAAGFRLVVATQQPVGRLVAESRWRPDFYYRVAGINLEVPALADHPSDIPLLIDHFLRQLDRPSLGLENLGWLASHPWPGNVRELRRAVERAVFLAGPLPVTLDHIEAGVASLRIPSLGERSDRRLEGRTLRDLDRAHITAILEETGGVVARAASILGLSPSQVYRRMQDLGIPTARRR